MAPAGPGGSSSCNSCASWCLSPRLLSRRIRSMALRVAVVVSQAPGLGGTPSAGHRPTAVANASAVASSAISRSPNRLVREATTRAHSSWWAWVIASRTSVTFTPQVWNGRSSSFRLQAFDPSAASFSATSRLGASMIQKPARNSFDSRKGPSVKTGSSPRPSMRVAVLGAARPLAYTQEPWAWRRSLNASMAASSPGVANSVPSAITETRYCISGHLLCLGAPFVGAAHHYYEQLRPNPTPPPGFLSRTFDRTRVAFGGAPPRRRRPEALALGAPRGRDTPALVRHSWWWRRTRRPSATNTNPGALRGLGPRAYRATGASLFRGRPPFAPFFFAARRLRGLLTRPAMRASSLFHAVGPIRVISNLGTR